MEIRDRRQNPFSWIVARSDALSAQGLRRTLLDRDSAQSSRIRIDGREYVNFSSNDYLGLANDARIRAAVMDALAGFGWGSGASPLVTGHSQLHAQLEMRLAEFEETESALLFPTGFAANAGVIPALVDAGSTIFSDSKNHASIIDGCRLSAATVQVYPHKDMEALEHLLGGHRAQFPEGRLFIVSDTLFSMDGDLANVPRLVELAESFGAMLMLDEAHATGVFGRAGRGVCEHFEVESPVILRTGTLSKSMGSLGGFVVSTASVVDWLVNRSRSFGFSTAAPGAVCAAGLAALELFVQEPFRRTRLLERAARLRMRLRESGWNLGSSESQIIPLYIGRATATMEMAERLKAAGLFVPGIRPPSVPEGESLLRISLCYDHDDEMVERLINALNEARDRIQE